MDAHLPEQNFDDWLKLCFWYISDVTALDIQASLKNIRLGFRTAH